MDPVARGRQHAFRPDRRFHPRPLGRGVFFLRRRCRHWQRLGFHRSGLSASIFLPRLRSTPITALHHYYAGSDSPPLLSPRRGIPASRTRASGRPATNHLMPSYRRFSALSSSRYAPRASTPLWGCLSSTRAWDSSYGSQLSKAPGRIVFVACGPSVPLPLLSTPPRGDAVTGGYKSERFNLRRTYTSLHECAHRRTSHGRAARVPTRHTTPWSRQESLGSWSVQ